MALEMRKSCLAGRSRLSESLQLYQILHPSAATSSSGTGSGRGETSLASMWGGSKLRLVFYSENLELLLPNLENNFHFLKSSLKIRRTTVFGMPSVSAINQDVTS